MIKVLSSAWLYYSFQQKLKQREKKGIKFDSTEASKQALLDTVDQSRALMEWWQR